MPKLYGNLDIKTGTLVVENNAIFSNNVIAESSNTANFDLLSANTLNIIQSINVIGGITANSINAQSMSANTFQAGQISSNGLTINRIATTYLSCNTGSVTLENNLTGNISISVNAISTNTYLGFQSNIHIETLNTVGTVIVFNHSTNCDYPQFKVINLSTNKFIIPDSIVSNDTNQDTLTFSEEVSVNITAIMIGTINPDITPEMFIWHFD